MNIIWALKYFRFKIGFVVVVGPYIRKQVKMAWMMGPYSTWARLKVSQSHRGLTGSKVKGVYDIWPHSYTYKWLSLLFRVSLSQSQAIVYCLSSTPSFWYPVTHIPFSLITWNSHWDFTLLNNTASLCLSKFISILWAGSLFLNFHVRNMRGWMEKRDDEEYVSLLVWLPIWWHQSCISSSWSFSFSTQILYTI